MYDVYLKNLRKSWLTGIIPSLVVIGFIGMISISWPSMEELMLARLEEMNNPIYKAILGDLGLEGLGLTWQGAVFMYAGGTINILLLVVALLPARLLTVEVDKNTLDIMLSQPVHRWRYLLEKFLVYLSYGILLPLSMISITFLSSAYLGTDVNMSLVINYSIGVFILLFALGALSLLCATIFLDSGKSLSAAGVLILGQYFLESMGGLIPGINDLQFLSLFHYFKIDTILENNFLPIVEVVIVLGVGILALLGSLRIFNTREFAI